MIDFYALEKPDVITWVMIINTSSPETGNVNMIMYYYNGKTGNINCQQLDLLVTHGMQLE